MVIFQFASCMFTRGIQRVDPEMRVPHGTPTSSMWIFRFSMVNHPSLGDLPMKTTPFFSRFRRLGGSNESHEALAIGLREPQLGVAALDEHQTFLLHLTWNGLEGCL